MKLPFFIKVLYISLNIFDLASLTSLFMFYFKSVTCPYLQYETGQVNNFALLVFSIAQCYNSKEVTYPHQIPMEDAILPSIRQLKPRCLSRPRIKTFLSAEGNPSTVTSCLNHLWKRIKFQRATFSCERLNDTSCH